MRQYRRLLPFILRQWPWLLTILALTALSSVVAAVQPWPLKLMVDCGFGATSPPSAVRRLLAWFTSSNSPTAWVAFAALSSLALFAVQSILSVALSLCWSQGGQRTVYALADELFSRLQRLSLSFHNRRHVGDSLSRLTEDTWCVYSLTDNLLLTPIHQGLAFATLAVVGLSTDSVLGCVSLGIAPLLAISSHFFGNRIKRRSKSGREAHSRIVSFVHQTLSAIPVVQIFNAQERNREKFTSLAKEYVHQSQQAAVTSGLSTLVSGLIATTGLALILYIGSLRVMQGVIPLGTLLIFLAYVRQMQSASGGLFETFAKLKTAEASVDRLLEVLDSDEMIQEPPISRSLQNLPRLERGRLQFLNVTTGYELDRPVLSDINLDVLPGEVIALVGPTGAGKSTLLSLIPRFLDPWSGRILLDGVDLRDLSLSVLRSQISLVLQDPFLLPLTVAENIAYGTPDASREQIIAAASAAAADSFIRKLPGGYDFPLGEQGANLSGGERQRLAFARAILRDAPILILDEPTSALDTATEVQLISALQRLVQGRTTFMIAHRLSTLRYADRILVLEKGRIVDAGKPCELLAREGPYRSLLELQQSRKRDEVVA